MKPSRTSIRAARRLGLTAALLGSSVLTDSAIEHYRGSFNNRAMYTPLAAAAATIGAGLLAACDSSAGADRRRSSLYAAAAIVGLAGLGFHAYNVAKRPGGVSWLNLFYAAPVGAPAALALAGVLGLSAEQLRKAPAARGAQLFGMSADRLLAMVSAVGLAGTTAEAALLHFRGAYHNPAMVLPVTVPPVGAALLVWSSWSRARGVQRLTRAWLKLTAALGLAGMGFHAYGVSRNMGGWRNWSQNLLNGPPIPAPPGFTALALSGLAALLLRRERP